MTAHGFNVVDGGASKPKPSTRADQETSLAAALLVRPAAAIEIAEVLPVEAVAEPIARAVYRLALELATRPSEQADRLVICERAVAELRLTESAIDLFERLQRRAGMFADPGSVRARADSILRAHHRQVAREAVGEMARKIDTDDDPVGSVLIQADTLAQRIRGVQLIQQSDAVQGVADALNDRAEGGGRPVPSYGYPSLEKFVRLRPGLVVLGARPGEGKSTLALNIATNLARQGLCVGIHSFEMTADELVRRQVCRSALVRMRDLENPVDGPEAGRIQDALGVAHGLPIFFNTTAEDIGSVQRKTLAMQRAANCRPDSKGLALVIVDYLQLIRHPSNTTKRYQQIGDCTKALKRMASRLGVCVLCVSAMNRGSEDKKDRKGERRRPQMSELRESGDIESDADVVMLMHRPNPEAPEHLQDIEVSVAKNRNDPTGVVTLRADYPYFTIHDPAVRQ